MKQPPPIEHHALENVDDDEARRVEAGLWWMVGRKAIIRRYLRELIGEGTSPRIMDIGCGSGGNFDVLAEFGEVYGVEPSATLSRRARGRGIAREVFQEDALTLDACRNMDLFTMFDVLEHIEDDAGFLRRLRAQADHPHSLLISVPACPFLYSEHDRLLHHFRRYTSGSLRGAMEAGGYRITHLSYFMFFLFPLVLAARMKEKLLSRMGRTQSSVDVGDLPPVLSVPFAGILRSEAALSRAVRFPIGLWLFATATSS